MNVKLLIKESKLFRNISDSAALDLAQCGQSVNFSQGETIFVQGYRGTAFYVVSEGMVKIFKNSQDGREIILKLIKPGVKYSQGIDNDFFIPFYIYSLDSSYRFGFKKYFFLTLFGVLAK